MRRLLIALLALALPLAGCDGDGGTGPGSSSHVGTFTLRTVNGNNLPFIVAQLGNDRFEVTAGSTTLNADGTWSDSHTIRITESGVVATETQSFNGTYVKNNNAIQFTDSEGDSYSGSLDGNTLTITVEGIVAVYRK